MLPIMLPTPVVRRKNKYRCSVPRCSSIYYWPAQPNVKKKRFYRLPKDDNRRQQWIDILGIPNGPKSVHSMSVCGDHFGEEAFTNTLRDRLNKYAKPLVPAPLVNYYFKFIIFTLCLFKTTIWWFIYVIDSIYFFNYTG